MSEPVVMAPAKVTVVSITVLVALSDGTVRHCLMNEKQAEKLHGVLVHKVMGGRLKLSREPVNSVIIVS